MHIWTRHTLQRIVAQRMRGIKFIAVSNREPYIHERRNGRIECVKPASGLTSAIDPIMRASGGVWVAHGSGSDDRASVDALNHVRVPPEDPTYTLRRVWVPTEIERESYYGLSNRGLWPLCHIAFHRPQFSSLEWASYHRTNELFSEAVLEEANGAPAFVFVQDYHLALLPRILRRANSQLTIAQFWHIPWPNNETFRTFPWKNDLVDGLLGNDLIGFQLPQHCANFLQTIESHLDARVDHGRSCVRMGGHITAVRAFPISIDSAEYARLASSPEVEETKSEWQTSLDRSSRILGIGIDRVDYTKGIPERLAAIDLLFRQHPEYIGTLRFVQVGVPSRTAIPDYHLLNERVCGLIEKINRRWARGAWKPIVFIHRHLDQRSLIALQIMADFCIVSALHDGMNLVAKEFVASRTDQDGVLILSAFAGAAQELTDALIINPFAIEEIAGAIHRAIEMPKAERRRRMASMGAVVAVNNIYRWATRIVLELSTIRKHAEQGAHEDTAGIAVDTEVA